MIKKKTNMQPDKQRFYIKNLFTTGAVLLLTKVSHLIKLGTERKKTIKM